MREINKFKSYNLIKQIFDNFPLRVQKFKATKWKAVQAALNNAIVKKILPVKKNFSNFQDTSIVNIPFKRLTRTSSYHKEQVMLMNEVAMTTDRTVKVRDLKSTLKQYGGDSLRNLTYGLLLNYEFRLDILLWKLGIFQSSFQAYQSIQERLVTVNNKICVSTKFLQLGDIISVNKHKNAKFVRSKEVSTISEIFRPFVESDVYCNNFVIVKNLTELGDDDFRLLLRNTPNLKKLRDGVRQK